MARTVPAAVAPHLTGTIVRPILMAEMEFDSGRVNMWNGIGSLVEESRTWIGIGNLGSISPVTETASVKATGLDFTLSGIDSDLLSIALAEDYQERDATLWMGFMDTSDNSYVGRIQIFKGRMDVMVIDEDGDKSAISVSTESILIGLERARERRFTNEDQKSQYPDDDGFEYVTSLQQKDIAWGR